MAEVFFMVRIVACVVRAAAFFHRGEYSGTTECRSLCLSRFHYNTTVHDFTWHYLPLPNFVTSLGFLFQ